MGGQSDSHAQTPRRVLAGDVGGTKTNLGVFVVEGDRLVAETIQTYPSANYQRFEDVLREFLSEGSWELDRCCLGVAGPVQNGRCFTTNLPWVISEHDLRTTFGFASALLLNDLVATAEAIPILEPEELYVLNAGIEQNEGNIGVVAAGTGLGEAYLIWDGTRRIPVPSEGGHSDFAPRNLLQVELWHYLHKRFGHVSTERIVSGPGLHMAYQFFRDTGRATERKPVAKQLREQDPAKAISHFALNRECPLCEMALDLFVSVYGAEAGNVALRMFTLGGIYLAGGVAPKILEKLKDAVFLKAFVAKGRLSSLLSKIPVKVILNQNAALLGAARRASLL